MDVDISIQSAGKSKLPRIKREREIFSLGATIFCKIKYEKKASSSFVLFFFFCAQEEEERSYWPRPRTSRPVLPFKETHDDQKDDDDEAMPQILVQQQQRQSKRKKKKKMNKIKK